MTKSAFENLRVYQLAEQLGDLTWNIVVNWDFLAKDTLGKQIINAADSIEANIAEGSGRGSQADNRRFAKIARGSLFEVKHWLKRAQNRGLLKQTEIIQLNNIMMELTPKLSAYINAISKKI